MQKTKSRRKAGRPPKPGGPGRPIRISPAQIEQCERVIAKHFDRPVPAHEAVAAVLEIGINASTGKTALVSPESFAVIEREIAQHAAAWALAHVGYRTRLDEQGDIVAERRPESEPLDPNESLILSPPSQAAQRLFH